jgi:hypothetical protein
MDPFTNACHVIRENRWSNDQSTTGNRFRREKTGDGIAGHGAEMVFPIRGSEDRQNCYPLAEACCAAGAARTRAGAFILIGDGIKVAKEAKFMPGVKMLHQDSENSSKAPWIFGHHFGVLGMLAANRDKAFCIPLMAELHEGAEAIRQLQGKDHTRTFILICSDLSMSLEEIVELYTCRFKIEVHFLIFPLSQYELG